MIGPAKGTADGYEAVSPKVFIGTSGGDDSYLSTDGGATWGLIPRNAGWLPAQHDCRGDNCSAPGCGNVTHNVCCDYPYCGYFNPSGVIGEAFFLNPKTNETRNFGYPLLPIEDTKADCRSPPEVLNCSTCHWYSCYTGFKTPSYMAYRVVNPLTGLIEQTHHANTTTFTGLPASVTLAGELQNQSPFVTDFGKDNGGVALLDDGTMVLTLDVRWGYDRGNGPDTARLEDLTVATSVVAFRSIDGGASFEYTATVRQNFPKSQIN